MSRSFDVSPVAGYEPTYGLMLAMLQDGTREWREELEQIDVDTILWQPNPGAYSIGGLMLHMAECEVYWIEQFCLDKEPSPADEELFLSKEIDQYAGKWPQPPREPLSYYYGILDDVRVRTFRAVKDMPPPDVMKSRGNDQFSMAWVLSHIIGHDSYHGGQIVMLNELYSRLKGYNPGSPTE